MKPLAEKMRPNDLKYFVGQEDILSKSSLLYKSIMGDVVPSMIFYGPSGTGKTTLAKIIANKTKSQFRELSAVTAGIKDLKSIIEEAEMNERLNQRTILFVDEIHRWNKKQQDALLPFVESGQIILIGATTENPSIEVNEALLSRCRVFVFKRLDKKNIKKILNRTIKENGIVIDKNALDFLSDMANGDARNALNILDYASSIKKDLKKEDIKEAFQKQNLYYDKDRREHHNLISALIKSMRAGEENAAIYYLARMLEAGEDPLFVARRIVVFASEDIGIQNSLALNQAVATYNACRYIGMPECRFNLTQAVIYMSRSNKSRKVSEAYEKAKEDVERFGNLEVPAHIKNYAMKYIDKKEFENKDYLPSKLRNRKYLS
jgi:putative ATPase